MKVEIGQVHLAGMSERVREQMERIKVHLQLTYAKPAQMVVPKPIQEEVPQLGPIREKSDI